MIAIADRNLLFGILALQMNLIARDDLIEAMEAWVLDKNQPLGAILVARQALAADARELLEALLEKHLQKHGNDPQKSLASLSSVGSVRQQLERVADSDVQESLQHLSRDLSAAGTQSTISFVDVKSFSRTDAANPPSGTRFRILRPHAKGGLGEVFVAEDQELHREVALKEIQEEHAGNATSRGRFVMEAELTGRLEHPGIVPVYGLGAYADGRPFYAMRFIRGDNLKHAVDRFHRKTPGDASSPGSELSSLPFRQLLRRFLDVCNAIAYAHSRGVLHRDLKPGNVMLGEFGETLVVDWGLAKIVGRHGESGASATGSVSTLKLSSGSGGVETVAGNVIGTPAFMSPEQAEGRVDQLGPATDVYSLGATLYCVLTGKAPVQGRDALEVLDKVRCGAVGFNQPAGPETPTSIGHIPTALVAACRKAMALQAANRYSSALALAADLEHWLADEPVSCHREPMFIRARRWARKRPRLTAVVAALLVTVTLGTLTGMYFVNAERLRTEEARKDADNRRREAETQRQVAVAIQGFMLDDLLLQNDPWVQADALLGHKRGEFRLAGNPTVRELLDRSAAQLTEELLPKLFPKQPLVQAQILLTVARCYAAIGQEDRADPLFARAHSGLAGASGPGSLEAVRASRYWGQSQSNCGKSEAAVAQLEQTRQAAAENSFLDARELAFLLDDLGAAYSNSGRGKQALAYFGEAATILAEVSGPASVAYHHSRYRAARAEYRLGNYRQVEDIVRRYLDARLPVLGPDHPRIVEAKNFLAQALSKTGEGGSALALGEECVATLDRLLGPKHIVTFNKLRSLLELCCDNGAFDKARQLVDRMIEAANELPVDHYDRLYAEVKIGQAFHLLGDYRRALDFLQPAAKVIGTKYGPDAHETLVVQAALARGLRIAGKPAGAVKILERVVPLREQRSGARHHDTLHDKNELAAALAELGQNQRALELFLAIEPLEKEQGGESNSDYLTMLTNIGVTYDNLNQPEKGLPYLQKAHAGRERLFGATHLRTNETRNNLASAYQSLGRLQDAIAEMRVVVEIQEKLAGKADPLSLAYRNNLATMLADNGKRGEAIALLEEAVKTARQVLTESHPYTLMFMTNLGTQLQLDSQNQRALPHLVAAHDGFKKVLGDGHPNTWVSRGHIGTCKLELKQFAEAESDFRACLTFFEKSANPGFGVPDNRNRLGKALLGQRKFSEAEPILLQARKEYQEAKATPSLKAQGLEKNAEALIDLYTEWKKPAEVEKWRKVRDGSNSLAGAVREVGTDLELKGTLDRQKTTVIYEVKLTAGTTYVIDMITQDEMALDPYLILQDLSRKELANDDDGGGGLNARITFRAPSDGVYRIQATSVDFQGQGQFTLKVKVKRD